MGLSVQSVNYPESVRIVEVAARDGLQNEKQFLPTQLKIQLVNQLSKTGPACVFE